MPRHIEQPAPRHSKPASMKISCSPRASAARLTACEPGHDQRLDVRRDVVARARCRAASSRSDSRPLVHEPMNATSIRVPCTRVPGVNP